MHQIKPQQTIIKITNKSPFPVGDILQLHLAWMKSGILRLQSWSPAFRPTAGHHTRADLCWYHDFQHKKGATFTNRGWTSASHHCWEIWFRIGEKYNFPRNSFFQWRQSDRKARPSSSVMHLWSPKPTQDLIHICMRANLPKTASFKHLSLSWGPSKILHPLSEGCGSRLSICQLNKNISKYWDGNAI